MEKKAYKYLSSMKNELINNKYLRTSQSPCNQGEQNVIFI